MKVKKELLVTTTALAMLAWGCTKKKSRPEAAAKAGAPVARRAPPAPAGVLPGEVTITSRSPAAVAAFRRARDLLANARARKATGHLRRAVRLDPSFARAHAMLALVTRGAERRQHLERAAVLARRLPEAERLMVEIAVAQARGAARVAEAKLKRLGALAPNDWRVQIQIGGRAFGHQKWGKVIEAMRRAARLAPTAGEPYNLMGYALAALGKQDEAVAALRRYAARKPGEPNPQDSLGEILLMAGRFAEAEKAFAKAGRLAKRFWIAWEAAAFARFLQGDWDGGRTLLARAREEATFPRDKLWVDIMRAKSLQAQGRTQEALRVLDRMEKAAKAQDVKVRYLLAPFHRGLALLAAGRYPKAAAELDEAFRRAPHGLPRTQRRNLRVRGNLARLRIALAKRDLRLAQRSFSVIARTIRKLPQSPAMDSRLHHARGLLALVRGDRTAAARHLSRCIPQYSECRALLARTQRALGDRRAAATRAALLKKGQRSMDYVLVRTALTKREHTL